MISVVFSISLITISIISIRIIDNLKVNEIHRNYFEGLIFGLIAALAIFLHYNLVEPNALVPKITVFLGYSSLIALSFFLFGYKAGFITLILQLISRVSINNEFLEYSVILAFISALNGFYFNLINKGNNSKYTDYKIAVILALMQSFLTLIVFFIGPYKVLYKNLYNILIYIVPVEIFINSLIAIVILKFRFQSKLLYNLKYEEAILSNVLYNLSEAVIIIDEHQNILRINNLAEKLTGFKVNEIKNRKLAEVFIIEDENFSKTFYDQIKNLKKNEIKNHPDITIISKKGEKIDVECKITCVFEEEFSQTLIVILIRDLTEIKNSHKKIEESEKRFRQFFNFSLEGIWRYEIKEPVDISLPADEQIKLFFEFGYLSDCNDTFAKMYGFNSKEELIGIPLSATLIPDDQNNINYLRNFILNNYRLSNAESLEKDKYGNIKYFINSLYGIIENDKIIGAWGIQIDVTEEKLTSKQIRENNRLLLSILNAPKGIIIFSLDRNYCYTAFSISHKETMKKIWGVDIEIGMNMLDAIKLEADKIKAKNNFDKVLNGEHLHLLEEYGDENLQRSFWLDNYSPIYDENEIIGLAVYVTDISQQKEIEFELENKNLLLNALINTIPDSIYVKDKNLRKILTNKTDLAWMGYDKEEDALGKRDDEIFGEEHAKISLEDDKKVIQGEYVINREEKIITKNGDEIFILTNKVPMYNKDGEIIGLVGTGRDITNERKYFNELIQNKQKLEIIFNQSFQFIGLLTPSGILLEANKTACDFIGVEPKDVRNLPFSETLWWTHSKYEQERLNQAIKSASEGNFTRMETTHLNKDKQERIIDFSITPIKNSSGEVEYLIAEGRDITDIKLLERKLSFSEEKYKILVEASLDAISIINSKGTILFSNEQHKKIFLSIEDKFTDFNYFELISDQDRENFKRELENIFTGKASTLLTFRFRKNKDKIFWGELIMKTFTDSENVKLCMCVLRDISYKKQIEDELKKRVFELEKYNQLMIGREIKMVELKKEVNSLCKKLGLPAKYSDNDI